MHIYLPHAMDHPWCCREAVVLFHYYIMSQFDAAAAVNDVSSFSRMRKLPMMPCACMHRVIEVMFSGSDYQSVYERSVTQ